MPTINDAIVVAKAYDTSGNGGRKLVKLNSGKSIVVVKDASSTRYLSYTSQDGATWSVGTSLPVSSTTDIALCTNGEYSYTIYTSGSNSITFNILNSSGIGVSGATFALDSGQTALGNVSLAINEAKTELHAAWASKNSAYPNSFNIRYAKGTINANGTVTWGAVEQITNSNVSGYNYSDLTIAIIDKKPSIICEYYNGTSYYLINHSTVFTDRDFNTNAPSNWGNKIIIGPVGYAQSSTSTMYVPQSINGLANGLIPIAWMGKDEDSNDEYYIRFSKSIDDGITWSTPSKLYLGSYPSITASKNGKLFITYVEDGATKYIESADNGDSWSTPTRIGTGTYPSSLIDFNINISVPLTIRRTVNEVFFSGSWSTETISPPVGERGQILNRQNILTYNITSESTLGTVTEKINGVVVGTKTLTSGQNTTVNITQAQWDAIPYGKYRNNSAGRNTIEIVTSNNTFTYTFEKWFDNTLDVISATKAVKDSKDYYLPSAKKIVVDAVNSKGGSATTAMSLEQIATQINNLSEIKVAKGNSVLSTSVRNFATNTGANVGYYYITIDLNTLGFEPKRIIYKMSNLNNTNSGLVCYWSKDDIMHFTDVNYANNVIYNTSGFGYFRNQKESTGILYLPIVLMNSNYEWVAYSD